MLNDKNLVRGLVLLGISLAFGLTATRYSFGSLGRAGPGLFPIIVSVMLGMIAGIVFMVFCASFAGTASYSVVRNLKISAGLIAVAFAFQKLLGFNLPLY